MMRFQTDKGVVTISSDVFTNIAGMAASNCFGVKGMGSPFGHRWTGASAPA